MKEWKEGEEPILHVEKRGRFITNMAFANFVSAAVDTGDDRKVYGHGLGLHISKRLVELQDGRIWVRSKEDQGSCFSFSLPIVTESKIVEEMPEM